MRAIAEAGLLYSVRLPLRLSLPIITVMWAGLACGPSERPTPPPRPEAPADKAALFGDPSLVPTRHGEQVRREIATAHELEQALSTLPTVERASVVVEALEHANADPRAVVIVHARSDADLTRLRQQAERATQAVVGPTVQPEVVVERSPAAATTDEPTPLRWPLLLGVLGLGLFGGVFFERLRAFQLAIRIRRSTPRYKKR